MNEQKERSFRGVWIPKHIWLNDDLSPLEKLFLAEIESLDNDQEKGCFASNEYFGNFFKISEGRAANIISSLRKRGFIKQVYFDGRFRGIRLHENVKAGFTEIDGRFHENVKAGFTKRGKQVSRKREHTIIVDNKVNNKEEKESVKNAFTPPFTHVGTIEIPNSNITLEAEKKDNDFTGAGPTFGFRACEKCGGAGFRYGRNGRETCDRCDGSRMEPFGAKPYADEFIITTVEPQAPYIRLVEKVEIPETPGPKTPGEKIRQMDDYRIKEAFTMSRKIPAGKFDDYLTAFDAETAATGQKHKNDADLIKHFLNFSGVRWSVEQRNGQQPARNGGRGAQLQNSGNDMSKYDQPQKF